LLFTISFPILLVFLLLLCSTWWTPWAV
jgi:hypothetical protein